MKWLSRTMLRAVNVKYTAFLRSWTCMRSIQRQCSRTNKKSNQPQLNKHSMRSRAGWLLTWMKVSLCRWLRQIQYFRDDLACVNREVPSVCSVIPGTHKLQLQRLTDLRSGLERSRMNLPGAFHYSSSTNSKIFLRLRPTRWRLKPKRLNWLQRIRDLKRRVKN